MVVTDYAKNKINLLVGGSHAIVPEYFMIGDGSGAAFAGSTTLENAVDRQEFTQTTFPSSQKTTWQGNWNSVEMSGIQLQQFGVIESGTGLTGSQWGITSLPLLDFIGTRELLIEETWEVF